MRAPPNSLRRRFQGVMFKLSYMISCEEFEEFMLDYLDDNLSGSQKRVFEMHLKLCRECREYLTAYESATKLATSALEIEAQTLPDVPEDLVQAIVSTRDSTTK